MPKKGKLDKNKEGRWRSLLESFRTSGKTQADFCKENDVSAHQFQYWMTEVKKRDAAKAKVVDGGASAFLPVSIAPVPAREVKSPKAPIEVFCTSGTVVRILGEPSSENMLAIAELIKRLEC